MTLRELVWMAKARQLSEWARIGSLVCWIGPAVWSKEQVKIERVIPAQFRPPPAPKVELPPEEKAAESRRGWHVLDTFFGKRGAKSNKKSGS